MWAGFRKAIPVRYLASDPGEGVLIEDRGHLMGTEAEQIKEAKNAILVLGICLVGAVIAAVIGLVVFHVI